LNTAKKLSPSDGCKWNKTDSQQYQVPKSVIAVDRSQQMLEQLTSKRKTACAKHFYRIETAHSRFV
jgi:ubiquinone/menaquinone biosynthesis C-methylase UbiE